MSCVTLVQVRSESEEVFTNLLCEEQFVIQITSAHCDPSEGSHSIESDKKNKWFLSDGWQHLEIVCFKVVVMACFSSQRRGLQDVPICLYHRAPRRVFLLWLAGHLADVLRNKITARTSHLGGGLHTQLRLASGFLSFAVSNHSTVAPAASKQRQTHVCTDLRAVLSGSWHQAGAGSSSGALLVEIACVWGGV